MSRFFHMHLVSDSTGETLNVAAKAAMASFAHHEPIVHIHALIRSARQMDKVLKDCESHPGIVFFTILDTALRRQLEHGSKVLEVPAISILDPMITSLGQYLNSESKPQVGGQHSLNADYFRRMDALNFTMAHDDGQNPDGIPLADIVILGISRTSKTPTSIYLAQRGYKVANVPLVLNSPLPLQLLKANQKSVVGLIASADRIAQIRKHRLLSINDPSNSTYVDPRKIHEEITYMSELCRTHGWPVIDVTRRSVEETSASVMKILFERQ